jgi:hypothetical protein
LADEGLAIDLPWRPDGEVEFRKPGLVKYAGAVEFSLEHLAVAAELTRLNPSFAIVASPRDDVDSVESVRAIARAALGPRMRRRVAWDALGGHLCRFGDVVIRSARSVDNREASLGLFMMSDLLDIATRD